MSVKFGRNLKRDYRITNGENITGQSRSQKVEVKLHTRDT